MGGSTKHRCDLLIIGSGIAGLSAAISAHEAGLDVIVITKEQNLEESNTFHAQGGIVCKGQNDSAELLINDIIEAGDGISNPDAVKLLATEGPVMVEEFLVKKIGVSFTRRNDGTFEYAQEGNHSRRRILHSMDTTGRAIEESLKKWIASLDGLRVFSNYTAIDLLTLPHHSKNPLSLYREPRCIGAYVLNNYTEKVERIFSSYTILATGGLGRIYLHTTNPACATGDGYAMAARAGARLINMEYVQFHPTTLFHNDANGFLISEAVRGEGARLTTKDGSTFMDKYSPHADLAPRDEVCRAMYEEMLKRGDAHVYLDVTRCKTDVRKRFPAIYAKCLSLGIDMAKDPIPVVPAAHYSCGGVHVDEWGRTSLRNLYGVGEVSATGLHGANRLASTSLLEGLVWGLRSVTHILAHRTNDDATYKESEIPEWIYPDQEEEADPALIQQDWLSIKSTMWNYVGIIRTEKRLERATADLQYLSSRTYDFYRKSHLNPMILSLRNGVQAALIVAGAAYRNRESRGTHYIV
jgi:L-aspartate oxidase